MTMTTHNLPLCIGMFVSLLSAFMPEGRVKADDDGFFAAIEVARSAWRRSNVGTPDDLRAATQLLAGVSVDANCRAYRVVELLRLRLAYRAGRVAQAERGFLELMASPGVAPECVLGVQELNSQDRRVRTAADDSFAQLLPMSVWSGMRNAAESEFTADIHPPPPWIPAFSRRRRIAIAELFDTISLHNEAWMAFVEAAYNTAPSWIGEPLKRDTWFSPSTAILWGRAARNAWMAGEERLAYDYLAKFAIFGSDAQFEEAKHVVGAWNAGKREGSEVDISDAQRRQALHEIFRHYAELNAHPRALELIERYRHWLDDPDELYAQYAQQWRAVVKRYGVTRERIVLFGVTVTDDVDPATIRIPWPLLPEAVKASKAELRPTGARKPRRAF